MKDKDTLSGIQFFYAFVWTFAALFIVGLGVTYLRYKLKWEAYLIMLGIVTCVSFAAAFFIQMVITGFMGFGEYVFGKRSQRGLHEQLAGDVERIRFLIRKRRYEEALKISDEILLKAPGFMEVKCLKSAILWEGFRRYKEAWELLRQILQATERHDPNHVWASGFYKRMNIEAKEGRGKMEG